MDEVWSAIGVILATLLLELGRRGLALLRKAEDRQTVVGAAARAAGQAVVTLRENPATAAATEVLIRQGAAYVTAAAPAALGRLGVPAKVVEGMVRGELGRLLAQPPKPDAGLVAHIGAGRQ